MTRREKNSSPGPQSSKRRSQPSEMLPHARSQTFKGYSMPRVKQQISAFGPCLQLADLCRRSPREGVKLIFQVPNALICCFTRGIEYPLKVCDLACGSISDGCDLRFELCGPGDEFFSLLVIDRPPQQAVAEIR